MQTKNAAKLNKDPNAMDVNSMSKGKTKGKKGSGKDGPNYWELAVHAKKDERDTNDEVRETRAHLQAYAQQVARNNEQDENWEDDVQQKRKYHENRYVQPVIPRQPWSLASGLEAALLFALPH